MRVFVTGASGHVGSAVVPELLAAGHQVVGLARSGRSAAALTAAGAEAHPGDLDDLDGLSEAAAAADGVIHLAFKHEAMFAGDFPSAVDADLRAIAALAEGLAGSDKPLVGTSGTMLLPFAGVQGAITEATVAPAGPRIDAENAVVALAERGIRSSVIRLAPTVHSVLDRGGFVPTLISIARAKGVAAYVGDGANRWPGVHTLDAARLYRLALEGSPGGARLHAVADEGVAFRQMTGIIGDRLGLPVVSIAAEQAEDHFGFLAGHATTDNLSTAALTRDLLGWTPVQPGLVEDLGHGHYFN
jgi:nucleoside-diphosphate-sugar epimerase